MGHGGFHGGFKGPTRFSGQRLVQHVDSIGHEEDGEEVGAATSTLP